MNYIITFMQDMAHVLFLCGVSIIEITVIGGVFYALVNGAMIGYRELKTMWKSI
jgi:hypothetical protein